MGWAPPEGLEINLTMIFFLFFFNFSLIFVFLGNVG